MSNRWSIISLCVRKMLELQFLAAIEILTTQRNTKYDDEKSQRERAHKILVNCFMNEFSWSIRTWNRFSLRPICLKRIRIVNPFHRFFGPSFYYDSLVRAPCWSLDRHRSGQLHLDFTGLIVYCLHYNACPLWPLPTNRYSFPFTLV